VGEPEVSGERASSFQGACRTPKLDLGRYTLVTTAVSAAGQRSNLRRLSPKGSR
jgi:hypothetical protein